MSEDILVERDGAVTTITLNRPQSRNAINLGMYKEIPKIAASVDADPAVKVVVLRGAGTKAFAAGADIHEFEEVRGDAESARSYNEYVAAAEHALEGIAKPTIAMVHGFCIGGGCGLALTCDFRFGDTNARFGITPAKLGLVYSLESTKRLVDLVGPAQAKWILFSGLHIDADRALRVGLVEAVHDPDTLESATTEFAATLVSRAQFSVRSTKEIIRRITAGQAEEDDHTRHLRNSSFDTADYAEGVRAFMEKRAPRFA
ncbi:enoyl-CoA hydratase/isomerase family protein [Spiractinospora alimapuensis]|uniref:enoyl-CoA hydratase-related protein n=1 Tax=Spiractinospora alimapuensis TaxID=2820884 RepID=UPI001F3672CF|nr:enoyl-CoA hydratase-related protein [Spiractinospora alimapuensis]QVQ52638.1 enoyl-CoA hydratase/isomerase family protein [Spiractinospora alimapuensis]